LTLKKDFHKFDFMTKIVKKAIESNSPQSHEKLSLILSASRERFAHYGYSKVTMEELAADIGMVKGSLYYYFPTKEHLFRAIIEQEQKQFGSVIDDLLLESIPPGDKLRKYALLRARFFRDLANLGALGIQSLIKTSPAFQDIFQKFERYESTCIKNILIEGKCEKEFVVSDLNKMSHLFLHLMQGLRLRVLRISPYERLDDEVYKQLERDMQLLVEVFLGGIAKR
jgi:TetR/AcrR family transcriptional regulator